MTEHSLRTRLLQHILVPLALTWLVSSLVVIAVASHFAQKAFDRSLLDDAYLLASRVGAGLGKDGTQLELNLTTQDLGTVLFDQSESIFFAIYNQQGELVAGHPGLSATRVPALAMPVFADVFFQNQTMRSVTLHQPRPQPFFVVVAQTTASRSQLLQSLLWVTVVPQVALLVLLGWGLSRDVNDLSPLPPMGGSRDVRRLGEAFNDLLERLQDGVRALMWC